MATTKKIPLLEYKEDFVIACSIHRMRPEELLQNFVNHIFYYGFINGTEDDNQHAAGRVIAEYLKPNNGIVEICMTQKNTHVKCLKKLSAILDNDQLSADDKRAQLHYAVSWCRQEISKKGYLSDTVKVSRNHSISLSTNFFVVCFIHDIDPQHLLQYFIDHISLAKELAVNQFKSIGYDPFMSFLIAMSDKFFKDSPELQAAGFYEYDRKLVDLYKRMKEESNLEKRIAKFTALYRKWYNAVKHLPVEPCFSA